MLNWTQALPSGNSPHSYISNLSPPLLNLGDIRAWITKGATKRIIARAIKIATGKKSWYITLQNY